jgi:predicted peroxiredoxin
MRGRTVRPLRIVVTTDDAERLRGALMLAGAQAALGCAATVFLQLDAVVLVRGAMGAPRDGAHRDAGLPTLAQLLEEAMALGVEISACQSGMAVQGMTMADLPEGFKVTGPVAFLQATGDEARLLIA